MKSLGMKVLILGLVVFLFSSFLGLFVSWYQFDMYVIKESASFEEVQTLVTVALFSQTSSVIAVLVVVIGMAILLKASKHVESEPSHNVIH